jgi:hypothetical protein
MPPVARPSRNGRPSVKVRRQAVARPAQPVVARPIVEAETLRHRARHHAERFALNCVETLTVECVVLCLIHVTPAAVAAIILVH